MRSNLQTYLLWAILGGFVAYVIFAKPDLAVDIKAYQMQINLLEQKIDSIKVHNKKLLLEADSLQVKLSEYDNKINRLNRQIYVIKKETQRKIDSVDYFGDDELEKFFAERYNQLNDSIN
tara:strand:+ start:216 stop:575 length:360 start_codon:yes stop_codon:yes gene_type:complete